MKLIPKEVNPNTKSEAEKLIFKLLQNSSLDGIAIHSLDLKFHVSKLYGEVDFLLITDRGVLCLEIKGGQVKVNQGQWEFINKLDETFVSYESPFKQARENKETIHSYVCENYTKKNGSEVRECVYGYGVVLPDTMLTSNGIEIDSEIVYDYNTSNFDDYITNLYDTWEERISVRLGLDHKNMSMPRLKPGHITLLAELLLGKTIDYCEKNLSDQFLCSDNILRKMSEEQYKMFQYGIKNRRQLVEGGAGTGKTIIALKYAIEKSKEGNSVLFICFNKLLASSISTQVANQTDGVVKIKIINFHDYLLEITGAELPEDKREYNEFYRNMLPEMFIEIADNCETFDTLIVDEGQDLFFENYLMCLDQFVTGGLSHGNWLMLYDENQNIYLRDLFSEGLKDLKQFQPFYGVLRENYRNTRQIDEINKELTNIYSSDFAGQDGENVDIHEYHNEEQGQKMLKTIIKHLHKKGVKNKDIVLLSPHRFEHSLLDGKPLILGKNSIIEPMQDLRGNTVDVGEESIKYSSIYSFKGLESHVIVIIDVDEINESTSRLYYTGISRAKSKLVIMKKV